MAGQAEWEAVRRVLCGVLPDWEGTDLARRSKVGRLVVRKLWPLASVAAGHLRQWSHNNMAGAAWLVQREACRGWLGLVLRAWREVVEREGGGGGAPMHARRWRVRWQPQRTAAQASSRAKRSVTCFLGNVSAVLAFPRFATQADATQAYRRACAVTTYMRVHHRAYVGERVAKRRREVCERVARAGLGLLEAKRARVAVGERCAGERREREARTAGPAARTRVQSTVPAMAERLRGVPKRRLVRRRAPTHVCAQVGRLYVKFVEGRRPRFGDG